jgi:hypothetical protein
MCGDGMNKGKIHGGRKSTNEVAADQVRVPEIKCGNNHCHWQGDWKDLKDKPAIREGTAVDLTRIAYCPLCASTAFWEITPPANHI